jgi:outer membrane protein OmpA-like peptidoglycan-associated protein
MASSEGGGPHSSHHVTKSDDDPGGLGHVCGPLPLEAAFEVRPPPEAIPQKLEVRETPTELRIELPGDVLFDFDKGDIRPELRAAN